MYDRYSVTSKNADELGQATWEYSRGCLIRVNNLANRNRPKEVYVAPEMYGNRSSTDALLRIVSLRLRV